MDSYFESISYLQDILRDSMIGMWRIEMDDGKPPRLFTDETFQKMMGMDDGLSPQESYRFWYERIPGQEREKVRAAIEEMIRSHHAEALYTWEHPEKGIIYIRCMGTQDTAYQNGLRFCGSHQDVSRLARVRLEVEQRLEEKEQEYANLTRSNEADREILNAIPGGVAVMRCTAEGMWVPEFLSEGFAAMCSMPMEKAWELYRKDAMTGVHPDDK